LRQQFNEVDAPTSQQADTKEQQQSRMRRIIIGRDPRRTLLRIVVLVIGSIIAFKFCFLPIRIEGISMQPTYSGHGINLVNRLAYLRHEPRRGDVVAIRTSGYSIMYMKRIVGLPGEEVAFHLGKLCINGKMIDEPYVKYPCYWEMPPRVLAADEYYVTGDNRSMPQADHSQGAAQRIRIVGKVMW
jgi:signal peptidase I